jgi:hypothetical protein
MLVGGVVVAVLGLLLFVGVVFARRKIATLLMASRKTARELTESARVVGQEIGGGGFEELVELAGTVQCARPLQSPLGGRPCVHYEMKVLREYEEDFEERDSQGRVQRRTRRGSETLAQNSESVEFTVDDGTGAIAVVPKGASFDQLTKSVERFDPGPAGATLSFGMFQLAIDAGHPTRRTLGHRYEEYVLPAGERITVIGRVDDEGGRLALRDGGPHFILSTRTRAELLGSAKTTAAVLGVLGTIAVLAGIALAVVGLVKK